MTTTQMLPLPGFRSEMRDIGGARLHAWVGGDPQGPPVVLWHGFLSTKAKVRQPVIAIGGVKGLGANVGTMVKLVAENVEAVTLKDCGHFVPDESPDEIVQRVLKIVGKTQL